MKKFHVTLAKTISIVVDAVDAEIAEEMVNAVFEDYESKHDKQKWVVHCVKEVSNETAEKLLKTMGP